MNTATQAPRINEVGRRLIQSFESCRLNAYRDAAGIWTIGWGHTPAERGQRLTQAVADALFDADLRPREARVAELAGPATEHQFAAMVSLAFNIGLDAFERSSVLRHHRAGKHSRAADAFALWNKAGGRVLRGLTRRRAAERALYLGAAAAG